MVNSGRVNVSLDVVVFGAICTPSTICMMARETHQLDAMCEHVLQGHNDVVDLATAMVCHAHCNHATGCSDLPS